MKIYTQDQPLITPIAVRTNEAAKMLNIGRTSLHHLRKSGKIPYTKLGRIVLFRIEDLVNFLKPPIKINDSLEPTDVVLNTLERMPNNG